MRLIILLFIILGITSALQSQTFAPINRTLVVKKTCPYNLSDSVFAVPQWRVYQTLDNTPNGVIDSSRCINLYALASYNGAQIDLSEVDNSKHLFVATTALQGFAPQTVYQYENFTAQGVSSIDYSDTCAYGPCSGFYINTTIFGSGMGACIYEYEYSNTFETNLCFPTVNGDYGFTPMTLLYRFKLKGNTTGQKINIYSPFFSEMYDVDVIYSLQQMLNSTGGNEIQFSRNGFSYGATLMTYPSSFCPTDTTLYFHELTPVPNDTTVQSINIIANGFENLVFAPYTRVIGGYPIGDTINRHNVNIINNGADMCMSFYYEKTFEHGEYYMHNSGTLGFEDSRVCFLFGNGGKLIVANGSVLDYGNSGRGMLALQTGGTIEINQGAQLNFGGTITMFEYGWETEPQQIYMDLNEGATFTFLHGAHITNKHSKDGSMQLNIYMKGGVLDLSGLPLEERKLINLIYPEPAAKIQDNINIVPNPIGNTIRLSYLCAETETLDYEVYNLNGDRVATGSLQATEGVSYHYIPADKLAVGTYIIRLSGAHGATIKKLLKL